jgi:DNA gyrase subunit B
LLLNTAIEGAALHVNADAPPLSGLGLESLARKYVEVDAIVHRWARRYDERFLEQLIYVPKMSTETFDRVDQLRDWCRNLELRLNGLDDVSRRYKISVEMMAGAGHRIDLQRFEHGLSSARHIPREFFESAEYLRIAELAQTLSDLMGPGAYVNRGDQRQDVASFKVAMNWLFEQAKKGQTIQRYKGLGEMNADQLWDTTINPETRRLMQVRIEDAVAADDIFTTLMGDAVEPRREFIEKNALQVSNLDI